MSESSPSASPPTGGAPNERSPRQPPQLVGAKRVVRELAIQALRADVSMSSGARSSRLVAIAHAERPRPSAGGDLSRELAAVLGASRPDLSDPSTATLTFLSLMQSSVGRSRFLFGVASEVSYVDPERPEEGRHLWRPTRSKRSPGSGRGMGGRTVPAVVLAPVEGGDDPASGGRSARAMYEGRGFLSLEFAPPDGTDSAERRFHLLKDLAQCLDAWRVPFGYVTSAALVDAGVPNTSLSTTTGSLRCSVAVRRHDQAERLHVLSAAVYLANHYEFSLRFREAGPTSRWLTAHGDAVDQEAAGRRYLETSFPNGPLVGLALVTPARVPIVHEVLGCCDALGYGKLESLALAVLDGYSFLGLELGTSDCSAEAAESLGNAVADKLSLDAPDSRGTTWPTMLPIIGQAMSGGDLPALRPLWLWWRSPEQPMVASTILEEVTDWFRDPRWSYAVEIGHLVTRLSADGSSCIGRVRLNVDGDIGDRLITELRAHLVERCRGRHLTFDELVVAGEEPFVGPYPRLLSSRA